MSKKKRQPQEGETIEIDWRPVFAATGEANWKDAVVVSAMAMQFRARIQVDGEPDNYYFYHDQGDTWRFKDAG